MTPTQQEMLRKVMGMLSEHFYGFVLIPQFHDRNGSPRSVIRSNLSTSAAVGAMVLHQAIIIDNVLEGE